tara:strand:- start:90 stop:620 length:531 start_codon:yes stop_codon:yes gene_type:complete
LKYSLIKKLFLEYKLIESLSAFNKLSEYLGLSSNSKDYQSRKGLNLSDEEILELAVKVVVHPTYGWLTTALILYGCRPVETFSLIPSSDGTASVIDFDESSIKNKRRVVLANPFDFVEKLNICDQISQPVFYENFEDYNFDELNTIISNWSSWFKTIKSNLELDDFRAYWAKRVLE